MVEPSHPAGSRPSLCERQYGCFQQAFRLPADAAEPRFSAVVEDGVQTLTTLRTASEGTTARRIVFG